MSVGGIVVGVSTVGEESRVTTAELACAKPDVKLDLHNATGVRVLHGGRTIYPGDTLWWQGDRAMLSPLRFRHLPDSEKVQGEHFDIVLERTGWSHETPTVAVGSEMAQLAEELCGKLPPRREG